MTRVDPIAANIRKLTLAVAIAFLLTSVGVGYWTFAREDLATDPYNPRLIATIRDRPRGDIVDRGGRVLARSERVGDAYRRQYADRSLAHVVGYASFRYGAAGVEASYGESLIGRDRADPVGQMRARYLGERTPPGSVVLGIDQRVQQAAAEALGGRRGAIIALDPRTGAILASVSGPQYDPNAIVDAQQQEQAWTQVNSDPARPLIDRATQGLYPPGSTIKAVTAAAALEAGGLDPAAKIRVDDPFRADASWGTYAVRSATQAHGDFDLSLAMQRSENIYFAKVGLTLGGQKLAEYLARFGIGRRPPIDGQSARGQISSSGTLDRPTLVADTAYGQGELLVSPLQMALVAATIGNKGVMPAPHYGLEVRGSDGTRIRAIEPAPAGSVIRSETAKAVTDALVDAVEKPGAFAYGARIPNVRVAGKTGTAENPSGAPHGWFIGFAPADAPTVAVAVLIENARGGGEEAAPLGGAVMRAALGAASR